MGNLTVVKVKLCPTCNIKLKYMNANTHACAYAKELRKHWLHYFQHTLIAVIRSYKKCHSYSWSNCRAIQKSVYRSLLEIDLSCTSKVMNNGKIHEQFERLEIVDV